MPARKAGVAHDGDLLRGVLPEQEDGRVNAPSASDVEIDVASGKRIAYTDHIGAMTHLAMCRLYLAPPISRGRPLRFKECNECRKDAGSNTGNPSALFHSMNKQGLISTTERGRQRMRFPEVDIIVRMSNGRGKGYTQTWPETSDAPVADGNAPAEAAAAAEETSGSTTDSPPAAIACEALPKDAPPINVGGPQGRVSLEQWTKMFRRRGYAPANPTELQASLDGVVTDPKGMVSDLTRRGFLRIVSGTPKSHKDPAMRVMVFRPFTVTGSNEVHVPPECGEPAKTTPDPACGPQKDAHDNGTNGVSKPPAVSMHRRTKTDLERELNETVARFDEQQNARQAFDQTENECRRLVETLTSQTRFRSEKIDAARRELAAAEEELRQDAIELAEAEQRLASLGEPPLPDPDLQAKAARLRRGIELYDDLADLYVRSDPSPASLTP